MKKLISSIFVGCALFFSLSAESLSDIVDSKYLNELTSKGKVSLIHEKKRYFDDFSSKDRLY